MRCHEEPRMHSCGLHCIKFTVISKFQVKGLRAQACLSHRRDFFQDGIFQKDFFFSDGFFRLFFFGWAFFGGVASMQKLVYFRFMRFSGRFRPSFTPFGANYGFPVLWTPFFSSKSRFFFRNAIFQKYFFFEWIFSTTFFSPRIFLGCRFDPEIGPLSIYEVFRAIPVLLHPRLEEISDFNFFINSFFLSKLTAPYN